MIVAGREGFLKSQYRKFNIRQAQTNDDFAMMREVLTRRFARAIEEDPDRDGDTWPDLVLLDMTMPEVDGLSVARKLARQDRAIAAHCERHRTPSSRAA